jgi:hypothetical protein
MQSQHYSIWHHPARVIRDDGSGGRCSAVQVTIGDRFVVRGGDAPSWKVTEGRGDVDQAPVITGESALVQEAETRSTPALSTATRHADSQGHQGAGAYRVEDHPHGGRRAFAPPSQ